MYPKKVTVKAWNLITKNQVNLAWILLKLSLPKKFKSFITTFLVPPLIFFTLRTSPFSQLTYILLYIVIIAIAVESVMLQDETSLDEIIISYSTTDYHLRELCPCIYFMMYFIKSPSSSSNAWKFYAHIGMYYEFAWFWPSHFIHIPTVFQSKCSPSNLGILDSCVALI